MSKSTENDNGRYFEYLVTRTIQETHGVALTMQAKELQARDSNKLVSESTRNGMHIAAVQVANWVSSNLQLDGNAILDRYPDETAAQKTHEDISIRDDNGKSIGFSLKHNHEAIFHGRVLSMASNNWLRLGKEHISYINFEANIKKIIAKLHHTIPPGTIFAKRGLYPKYVDAWSLFVSNTHDEVRQFLSYANEEKKAQDLFRLIIGTGSDQFRVLKKNKRVLVQDLRDLKLPNKVDILNRQRITKDPRSAYVWHLVLEFNNGLVLDARSKQDSGTMTKGKPPLKHDWQVIDWGDSGMSEIELP